MSATPVTTTNNAPVPDPTPPVVPSHRDDAGVPSGPAGSVDLHGAAALLGRAPGGLDYLNARVAAGATPGDVLAEALTARAFSIPSTTIAQSRAPGSTFLYEFGYRSPQSDIRAGHAVEIPFVFDHLDAAHPLVGPEPDQRIADEMHRAWVQFATTGDPGWAPIGDSGEVRRFS